MRLTVGPLPPAVYWRRRAVVLGVVLLFVIVFTYSCTGSPGDRTAEPGGTSSPTSSPTPTATASVLTPETPSATVQPAGPVATDPPVVPAATAPPDGSCTDEEMSVTPVAEPNPVQRGANVDLHLKIKNTSQRTCSRDVGADLQELFIKVGAQKIWSSDTCGTAKGSDVRSFTPGFEREYTVTWNGHDSTRCANGVATGPYPKAGEYQLFGRLGTKLSEPVKLTISG